MKGIIKATQATGKVTLVLLGAILMPVLIWVALGAAVNTQLKAKEARQPETETAKGILAKAEHITTK